MTHQHSNAYSGNQTEVNLLFTMTLNFLITIVEIVGGILSGSLSLLSDAIHNFSDGVAIIVSYVAIKLSIRPRTLRHTFGLKRTELIAAIINASTLVVISFFLIKTAVERFSNPVPITGNLMLIVALVGLVANVVGTMLLKKGSDGNINIRAAYLHQLSDAIASVAVIVGAVFIMVIDITWIDPILTILISLYIVKEAYEIVKEAVDVILMTSPDWIDIVDLKHALEAVSGVRNIHHVHVWKMNDVDIHFEAHIDVDDLLVSQTSDIRAEMESRLLQDYNITHTTLQFECGTCDTKDLV